MFPINVVEKETGINKYLLRMWERRYSFPRPVRDLKGERLYSDEDVLKLKIVKSLMKEGYRPSKIIDRPIQELKELQSNFARSVESEKSEKSDVETVILITNPNLEQAARELLSVQKSKKFLVVSSLEELQKIS
jgi:DNA-binding transcriptional MerR regulator